ncbi:hypothetical protein [Brevundimonas sp.]
MNFQPSLTDPYPKSDLLKCQAFVVFCHAEIQVYWESIAKKVLKEAENRWKAAATIDRVLAALVAFRCPDKASIPSDPLRPHDGGNLSWLFTKAIAAQYDVIGGNNGIKRYNISELLLPLGILPEDITETLLIQLDQTGAKRGTLVHKSSEVSLRTIRDPFTDEMADIDLLVVELGLFDAHIESIGLISPAP